MSITELRDKYNKALLNCKFLPHAMAGQSPEKVEKAYLEMITTDLNALIQSEDKERRELLERYTVYLNKTNRLKNLYVEPFDLIDSFLESENK